MEELNHLIQALKNEQGERSQEEFAAQLGFSRDILSLIYNEKRTPSLRTLRMIARNCPNLQPAVARYIGIILPNNATSSHEYDSICRTNESDTETHSLA